MRVVETGHIVIEPDVLGGEPHIAGHHIAVSHIVIWTVYQGMSPGEIAETFRLTLGKVHAAPAYYYDHKDQIDAEIAESERRHQELAERYPHGWSPADGMPPVVEWLVYTPLCANLDVRERCEREQPL